MATPTTEYIRNPRRSPRVLACCRASVTAAVGRFEATTENIGAHGCRLVAPRLVREGEPVQLVLTHPGLASGLRVNGRIAWATKTAPWRLGIAFDESAHPESSRWASQLLSTAGPSASPQVPDRIPLHAAVYLGAPPRFVLDVTSEEMSLLQEIQAGVSVGELVARFPGKRPTVERALFSLLAQRLATLTRGASVHPNAWSAHLTARQPIQVPLVDARHGEGRMGRPQGGRVPGSDHTPHHAMPARVAGGQRTGGPRLRPFVFPMIPPDGWSYG